MKAQVSEKGQVTFPKPLRNRLGIRPGQTLELRAEYDCLVAATVAEGIPVDGVSGILKLGRPPDELMKTLRGTADTV